MTNCIRFLIVGTCIHTHSKTKGFENEERLVYQIIEDAGNKGVWVRDIRLKSNLVQTQLMRLLRSLDSRKLIKSVKSVQASKRKVYMLYELTPHESLTGGAWYSDQDFESEFVEVLNQHSLRFLKQKVKCVLCEFDFGCMPYGGDIYILHIYPQLTVNYWCYKQEIVNILSP